MPISPSIVHPGTLSTTSGPSGNGTAYASDSYGPVLFVNTVTGVAGNTGTTPVNPMATMAEAFAEMAVWEAAEAHSADNTTIYWAGVIEEQITTPLSGEANVGVSGVKVIALVGGGNRHDDGARWKAATVAGNAPLVTVRGQGWVFDGGLFAPQSGYAAIRGRRQEDATYPDASHMVVRNCRFIGSVTTPAGIGFEDYGGMFNVLIENNTFVGLVDGYLVSNQGISMPHYTQFLNNVLVTNTNHFRGAQECSVIQGNRFLNLGATTYINTAYGNTGLDNMVILNWFPDLGTDIKNDSGYTGNATDTWSNYSTGTAALIVESPPGAS